MTRIDGWMRGGIDAIQKYGLAWMFGGVAWLILPLSRYGHKGLAPLFSIFALAALGICIARRHSIRLTAIGWTFVAYSVLVLASTSWSITPSVTLKTAISMIGTLAGAYLLFHLTERFRADGHRIFSILFAYGGLVGLILLSIDIIPQEIQSTLYRDRSTYDSVIVQFWNIRKTALTVASIFVWPWAMVAWRYLPRPLTIIMLAVFAVVLAMSEADAARAACLVAMIAAAGAALLPRAFPIIFATGLAIVSVILPILVSHLVSPTSPAARYDGFSQSAMHRIIIWQNTATKIFDNPIFGSGFDTARALYRGEGKHQIIVLPSSDRPQPILSESIPLHPHNMVLQIWVETGAIGISLYVMFLVLVILKISRNYKYPGSKVIAYGALTSGLFIANVSFGAWQAWWLAAVILVATLTMAALSSQTNE